MTAHPTGTVTFLFTDIEGSTRRWQDEPEVMRALLVEHDAILRDVIDKHHGHLFKHTGDGVAAAFASACDAVTAALDAQEHLREVLPVRMGLHTGEAELRDGDYFGSTLNRCARLMGVASGRQIVCSEATAALVRDRDDLRDLGEHRLRDLVAAERVWQIGGGEFAALQSLDTARTNLPLQLSSFVGRAAEMDGLAALLADHRLVTLTGVGGVGKTRLALEVGAEVLPRFADGVWVVELAQVLDPDDLVGSLAAAVGYVPPQGVSVVEGLPRFLERKALLLVLDNCEHLLGAVARWVAETTTAAARVSVLATSREALGLRGEHIWPLGSLALPDDGDVASVVTSESGALFAARAGEARGGFVVDDANVSAIRDLCVRLDGIPLAIELASAQTKVMTPGEILKRLDKQFRLLTGGPRTSLERHQTLRAAIDWSYDLLGDLERALLDRLSVCVGGFDLDAAASLAVGFGVDEFEAFELLASLAGKSLAERNERNGATRYRLLEMIRQYAAEKLRASGEVEAARDEHARHYLSLAIEVFRLTGTRSDYDALAQLETETPNFAASGRWMLATDRTAELLGFFDDLPFLDPFAWPPTTLDEFGAIAADAIDRPDAHKMRGHGKACWVAGAQAFFDGDLVEYRRLTDIARTSSHGEHATTSIQVATVALFDSDIELALTSSRAATARARVEDDPRQLAWTLAYQVVPESICETGLAPAIADEALAIARGTGGTIAQLYALVGMMSATSRLDPARALWAAEECIRNDRTRRQRFLNMGRASSAAIRLARGEIAEGLTLWREVLHSLDHGGDRTILAVQLSAVADGLATVDLHTAIDIAALSESDAIAHFPAFAMQPNLRGLADSYSVDVTAARARFANIGYNEAIAFLYVTIDRLIAEQPTNA